MRIMDIVDVILLMFIGVIFHVIFPGISVASGMKPDFSLAILFVIILLKKDIRLVMSCALVVGIVTSLSSTIEIGRWYNLIDKMVTTGIMYYFANHFRRYFQRTGFFICIVATIGTIISWVVFGLFVVNLGGLSLELTAAIVRVLLPAVLLNMAVTYVLYVSMEFGERLSRDISA